MDEKNKTWVEQLNSQAQQYESKGLNSFDVIEQVASDFKLTMLSEGDTCRVYQTPDGVLVNCWVDETSKGDKLREFKFDHNIAWYTRK